jgi:hypothetical protein
MRQTPQPDRVRVRTEDDETKDVELSANARVRWRAAEETIRACRAVEVELLDKKGAVLRARKIDIEPLEGESTEDVDRRKEERAIAKERRDLAAILDAAGRRHNEAFDRGSEASAKSHDALIALVQTLTENLSLAITNLHNMSANYAILAQQAGAPAATGEDGNPNTAMLAGLLANVARQMGMGAMVEQPNGKPKKGAPHDG